MKRFFLGISGLLFGATIGLFAADLVSSVNTENGVLYNKVYRDGKDGNNYQTMDVITANTFGTTSSSVNSIKGTGGYLEAINLNAACTNGSTVSYVVADAAASAASYATVISTIIYTSANPIGQIPFKLRFTNGLAINTIVSTCTVTAIYR